MKDLFICSCNELRQTKNARTSVQPHTPQLSKTQRCGMLPEGTCEECPRTKWLVCLLRVNIVRVRTVRRVTIYGILDPWRLLFGRILHQGLLAIAELVRVSCPGCKHAVS